MDLIICILLTLFAGGPAHMEAASLAPALMAGALCLAGDVLGSLPYVVSWPLLRAAVDSLTHGLVGVACWTAVVIGRTTLRQQFLGALLAGALAMLLDVDHFLMARSLELKAATSLPRRPPFHATTIIPVIAVILWILHRCINLPAYIPWLFSVSWFSHHIRDGTRRGLWCWPLRSTPPLPTWMYLGGIVSLPLIVRLLLIGLQIQVGQVLLRPANLTLHL